MFVCGVYPRFMVCVSVTSKGGLCAMCNCKKRKRLNEEEEDHVTAESSYQKLLSRCAMMAAELEQVR